MAVYTIPNLTARVIAIIKANGTQAITGPVLQGILIDIIDSFAALLGIAKYTRTFTTNDWSSNQLVVTHSLNTAYPSLDMWDSNGRHIGEVNYEWAIIDDNQIIITVTEPFGGKLKIT